MPPVDQLKYQPNERSRDATTENAGQLLTVKLRQKKPDGQTSELSERTLTESGAQFANASADFKFAAAVAEFGMILRGSPHKGNGTMAAVAEWAQESKGRDEAGYRAGFIDLVRKARARAL